MANAFLRPLKCGRSPFDIQRLDAAHNSLAPAGALQGRKAALRTRMARVDTGLSDGCVWTSSLGRPQLNCLQAQTLSCLYRPKRLALSREECTSYRMCGQGNERDA